MTLMMSFRIHQQWMTFKHRLKGIQYSNEMFLAECVGIKIDSNGKLDFDFSSNILDLRRMNYGRELKKKC